MFKDSGSNSQQRFNSKYTGFGSALLNVPLSSAASSEKSSKTQPVCVSTEGKTDSKKIRNRLTYYSKALCYANAFMQTD